MHLDVCLYVRMWRGRCSFLAVGVTVILKYQIFLTTTDDPVKFYGAGPAGALPKLILGPIVIPILGHRSTGHRFLIREKPGRPLT